MADGRPIIELALQYNSESGEYEMPGFFGFSTTAHEFGHALDSARLFGKSGTPKSPAYQAALERDRASLMQRGFQMLLAHESECYADIFVGYVMTRLGLPREELTQRAPHSNAYFEDLMAKNHAWD